jgi:branched-subunit amino acid transport protein
MTVVTWLTRLPLIVLSARRVRVPRLVQLVLDQIPAAAFAAIVFPAVLAPHGHLELHASNLYVWAALASVGVAVATRNLLATIVVGVAVATLLRRLVGLP